MEKEISFRFNLFLFALFSSLKFFFKSPWFSNIFSKNRFLENEMPSNEMIIPLLLQYFCWMINEANSWLEFIFSSRLLKFVVGCQVDWWLLEVKVKVKKFEMVRRECMLLDCVETTESKKAKRSRNLLEYPFRNWGGTAKVDLFYLFYLCLNYFPFLFRPLFQIAP